jgi:hypothetical protein
MAASIRRSPVAEALPLCASAKPATSRLPTTENSQKAGLGRSPPRRTPKIAVASGSRPMNTIECAEVMCWSANAVSNGKPTTTPSATMASEPRSVGAGRLCLRAASRATPSNAAMTARADVRNKGEKPPTATRVAGNDPLKMITPMRPLPHPSAVRCTGRSFRSITTMRHPDGWRAKGRDDGRCLDCWRRRAVRPRQTRTVASEP